MSEELILSSIVLNYDATFFWDLPEFRFSEKATKIIKKSPNCFDATE